MELGGIGIDKMKLTPCLLSTITISAESLRFSVLHYTITPVLKTTINLPFPIIVPYGAVLSLS